MGRGWVFRTSKRPRGREPEGPWIPTPGCSVNAPVIGLGALSGWVRVGGWGVSGGLRH